MILWEPSEEAREASRLTAYTRWLATRGLSFESYADLWAWSVDDLEAFWVSIWDFFGVRASQPYDAVLPDRRMPGARWFPGSELSYAEHVFQGKDPAATALVALDAQPDRVRAPTRRRHRPRSSKLTARNPGHTRTVTQPGAVQGSAWRTR